jgi:hypothetical protein
LTAFLSSETHSKLVVIHEPFALITRRAGWKDVVYVVGSAARERKSVVGLQRHAGLAAIRASPVPELKKPDPLDGRVRSGRTELASMPAGIGSLADVAVLASILNEVSGKALFVAFVIGTCLRGVLGRMSLPPTPHGLASFLRITSDPFAAIFTSTFRVLVRHSGYPTNRRRRAESPLKHNDAASAAAPLLRGKDSNL